MPEGQSFVDVLLSPPVLLTFLACALVAGVIIWLQSVSYRRRRESMLSEQRRYQEVTVERLLDSVSEDKDRLIAEYEERLRERDERIAALESSVSRLRDRLTSSGLLGLFGGKQRDVVGALLLENEQLHELLVEKQQQLRDLMAKMTQELIDRLDEQTEAGARAVRYKQVLLSAFLQHEEARQVLDRLVSEGKLTPPPQLVPQPEPEEHEDAAPKDRQAEEM